MSEDITNLFPILEDKLAIKIMATWQKIRDVETIAEGLSVPIHSASKKIRFLYELGLIDDDGISDTAKRFLNTQAASQLAKLVKK